jgi:putative protein-disulfide isomerase
MPYSEFIYFGDPMCSWCWGFAPVLDALRHKYGGRFHFRIVVGGLRPGRHAEPLDERLKTFLRHEWRHIQEATGQPFDFKTLDREGFLYDTDPAARAVVTMRRMKPVAEFDFFSRLQRAFYAENTDITNVTSYPTLVQPFGVDETEFICQMTAEEVERETEADYAEARNLGVTGFPSLLLRQGENLGALTYGYQPFEKLDAIMQKIV